MGDIEMLFTVTTLDKRNDKSIVHSVRIILSEHGVQAGVLAMSFDDYLNENDGNWADLLKQSVADTVRNMSREFLKRKGITDISDDLLRSGNLSLKWMENDQMVETPGGVAGESLGDLIERFESNHDSQNKMFVEAELTLK